MTVPTGARTGGGFYLWVAIAMTCTVFAGFSFTYFGPLLDGGYPQVSPLVHVHGWTFFAWYPLLIAQAGLIRTGRVSMHRLLGSASTVLAVVMIAVGLIVSTVRIDMALGTDGDPFWAFMGLPIFSIWILFTVFYVTAIFRRRRSADHKRFMLLASAVGLSAATFRIVVRFLGFEPSVAVLGMLAPGLFVLAAMVDDLRSRRGIHPVYGWGLLLMVAVIGGACLVATSPGGERVTGGVAWLGRLLRPLY